MLLFTVFPVYNFALQQKQCYIVYIKRHSHLQDHLTHRHLIDCSIYAAYIIWLVNVFVPTAVEHLARKSMYEGSKLNQQNSQITLVHSVCNGCTFRYLFLEKSHMLHENILISCMQIIVLVILYSILQTT